MIRYDAYVWTVEWPKCQAIIKCQMNSWAGNYDRIPEEGGIIRSRVGKGFMVGLALIRVRTFKGVRRRMDKQRGW